MCLFPQLIRNKKYTATTKNGGIIPAVPDKRVQYVPTPCGNCKECRKKKAREWQIRLTEDIKQNKNAKFVTLTFSNENYTKLANTIPKLKGYDLDNAIATKSIHLFRERHRKLHKKSIRHWLVTELGHKGTENIHMHGILWTDLTLDEVEKIWQYGHIWKGKIRNGKLINYVNEQTINYTIKYISKIDFDHQFYKPLTLTSPGIGKCYLTTLNAQLNKYNDHKTNETYKTQNGHKIALPTYYRNKLYTEEQKEKLWIKLLDKQIRWVDGQQIDITENEKLYYQLLKEAQERSIKLGYTVNKTWQRYTYEQERRILKQLQRRKNSAPSNGGAGGRKPPEGNGLKLPTGD